MRGALERWADRWRKRSAWPDVAKSGKRAYRVGFYDHDKRERTEELPFGAPRPRVDVRLHRRRALVGATACGASCWISMQKRPTKRKAGTIAEVVELFLETDAHPRNEEGLAPATYADYTSVLNSHLLGKPRRTRGSRRRVPAARLRRRDCGYPRGAVQPTGDAQGLAGADAPGGCAAPRARVRAWRALSSALSWASASALVPEIETNGSGWPAAADQLPRSARRGGTGDAPRRPPRARWPVGRSPAGRRGDPSTDVFRSGEPGRTRCSPTETRRSSACNTGSPNPQPGDLGTARSSIDGYFAWVTEVISYGRLETGGRLR